MGNFTNFDQVRTIKFQAQFVYCIVLRKVENKCEYVGKACNMKVYYFKALNVSLLNSDVRKTENVDMQG